MRDPYEDLRHGKCKSCGEKEPLSLLGFCKYCAERIARSKVKR